MFGTEGLRSNVNEQNLYIAKTLYTVKHTLKTMNFKSVCRGIWQKWMKIGKFVGYYNTKLLLGLMYYTVFTLYRLIARLLRKDFLDLKMKGDRDSYWKEKENIAVKKEDYFKQY